MRTGIAIALGVTLAAAAPAGAQEAGAAAGAAPRTAGVPGCTYDTCALRRERVFLSERVLAGVDGRVVGRPGVFGVVPAAELVRAVPEAVPYARRYQREARLGQALVTVGSILSLVALVDAYNNPPTCTAGAAGTSCDASPFRGRQIGLAIGGIAVGAVGGWRVQVADRALNRSLWYYNRALAR